MVVRRIGVELLLLSSESPLTCKGKGGISRGAIMLKIRYVKKFRDNFLIPWMHYWMCDA
jgi:hypothetical protein